VATVRLTTDGHRGHRGSLPISSVSRPRHEKSSGLGRRNLRSKRNSPPGISAYLRIMMHRGAGCARKCDVFLRQGIAMGVADLLDVCFVETEERGTGDPRTRSRNIPFGMGQGAPRFLRRLFFVLKS